MSTDRELLEMAAKAAGLAHKYNPFWHAFYLESTSPFDGSRCWDPHSRWNPLEDDGDALRLAVKLHIDMRQFLQYRGVVDTIVDQLGKSFLEEFTDDPYAATRRAIVRAAAEIGRNMP